MKKLVLAILLAMLSPLAKGQATGSYRQSTMSPYSSGSSGGSNNYLFDNRYSDVFRYYRNTDGKFGTFTLRVVYNGSGSDRSVVVVKRDYEVSGARPLSKAIPDLASDGYVTSRPMRYARYRGSLLTPPDTAVVYRLPYSMSRPVVVEVSTKTQEGVTRADGSEVGRSRFTFTITKPDTVYAMRLGMVVEINGTETASKKAENISVTVEHPDKTLAYYDLPIGSVTLVKEGRTVYPGTPLAIAGNNDGSRPPLQYSVGVGHLISARKGEDNDYLTYEFIDPFFATTEGNVRLMDGKHIPVMNSSIATAEMSAREKRKYMARLAYN